MLQERGGIHATSTMSLVGEIAWNTRGDGRGASLPDCCLEPMFFCAR